MKLRNKLATIAVPALFLLSACQHNTEKDFAVPSLYVYDNSSTVFSWTAHKFTNRTSVSGVIPMINVVNTNTNKMAAATLLNSSFTILENSLLTTHSLRDSNIFNRFFSKLDFPADISGRVLSVSGTNDTGAISVLLSINQVSDTIQMNYGLKEDILTAKANVDLLKFHTQRGFDSMDVTCHGFHTGSDGISKLWSDIDISVKTVFIPRY